MSATNPLWTNVNAITLKDNLIEQIVNRSNINKACKRVIANGGSPGIDGMEVKQLGIWLQRNICLFQSKSIPVVQSKSIPF
jgi:hypothetical protein